MSSRGLESDNKGVSVGALKYMELNYLTPSLITFINPKLMPPKHSLNPNNIYIYIYNIQKQREKL